ncbi:hypothetical protein SAMN05216403_14018, partial [Nitrosospira multiformis ATCC 25196]
MVKHHIYGDLLLIFVASFEVGLPVQTFWICNLCKPAWAG